MSAEPNYYELIGVERNATLHEIRTKFRAKVLAEHPDKGGDPKKFQMLNKAYNVLTDVDKRKRYDQTGRTEISAEEEFARSFGGGRHQERSKDADKEAVVNISEKVSRGPGAVGEHEEGFQEWLRQRDQSEMVMTDKDFMQTRIMGGLDESASLNHKGPVQHVLGSPKTDAYGQALGGAVQVQSKPRPMKKCVEHDEIVVRMLAVPVDDSMVYAELNKTGVCLGMTGVGRIEQVGGRVQELQQEDPVLVIPKPSKFNSSKPIGTARTLLICNEDDVIKISPEILEELTPEQICLAPAMVAAYILLEKFGTQLKPGDSILLNAAHLSATGTSLLQLCKLLKLKPLCILQLPGAPLNRVKGEYGSKSAWQDADSRAVAPPTVRAQYERISEWLITMGAEEVFPDAVALLRWRDRNQRMLPKVGLDGVATRESSEQLIHCVKSGEQDAKVVVYGFGTQQPLEVSPPLLAAWGGELCGFNLGQWLYSLSSNEAKMMAVVENLTKLVRANKFTLDTVLYKVGEDAISDAFARTADASDASQVVLIFPTLAEELQNGGEEEYRAPKPKAAAGGAGGGDKRKDEDERDKLKSEWLSLLFTEQSVAATSDEGPVPTSMEGGNQNAPGSLVVWLGDKPKDENAVLKDLSLGNAALLSLAWTNHPAGESLSEIDLNGPEVVNGTWYLHDRTSFDNEDLDHLHDVELLGRSMVSAIDAKLQATGLDWGRVVLVGFGKGAGIALYASMLKIIPKPVGGMVLFSPIVLFPSFLVEKMAAVRRTAGFKLFIIWGNRNKSTPGSYRQLLAQTLRKAPEVQSTVDTMPDGGDTFDAKSFSNLSSILSLVMPR